MELRKYIEIHSDKRFGKPVLVGTRIAVADVLSWLASGMSREEILHDFPELTNESINACLLFAAFRESHLGIAS